VWTRVIPVSTFGFDFGKNILLDSRLVFESIDLKFKSSRYLTTDEINEELSELRKKLKQVEADKSSICARLVHIQGKEIA